MPRKQDLSAQRVRKHIEIETGPLAHALGLVNEAALLGAAYEAAQEFRQADWDNAEQRSHAAHYALTLDDLDEPLKKAFDAFELDPRNPFHWRKLLAYLAEAHFGPKCRRGPPKLGGWQALSTLGGFRSGQKPAYARARVKDIRHRGL